MEKWRQIQKENFTRLETLLQFLELDASLRHQVLARPSFPLNLPRRLAEKIKKNTLDDPILRQFLPLKEELAETPGFVLDPVQDKSFCQTEKLLKKYEGRALLLTTSACAMHCRFCFRQNFPYEKEVAGFTKELEILRQDATIAEVILSGGDPLSLGDHALAELFGALEQMAHVKRIRFHTRFPIGIPERIDVGFLRILTLSSKQIFFVAHCNHPRELDADVALALKKIRLLGIPVLNQAVLLRGVNDDETTLLALSEALVNAGILPYYLHQLDRVQGTAHFAIEDARAIALIQFVQEHVSGYGVPRLVREEAGHFSKTAIHQ